MKNKRLIILLSIFAFLVLIAVLCSTVFTVKKVQVNWLTTKAIFTESDETIIKDVKKGESVFLVDKTSIKEKLEADFPYLKVVGLEIKFPNKLVVHTAERQELYSIKVRDNLHYILDGDCKVLRSSSDANLGGTVAVEVVNYTFPSGSFEVSKVANLGYVGTVLNSLTTGLLASGYESIDIKNNLKSVKIDVTGYNENLEFVMRGVTIKVNKITSQLLDKIKYAIGIFDTQLTNLQKETGSLTVYAVNGVIKSEYEA